MSVVAACPVHGEKEGCARIACLCEEVKPSLDNNDCGVSRMPGWPVLREEVILAYYHYEEG